MELLIAVLIGQVVIAAAGIRAFYVLSQENYRLAARIETNAVATNLGFDAVAIDIASVVGVRDSMDREIRERQASIDTVVRLVGRQGRAISEHIESNLH